MLHNFLSRSLSFLGWTTAMLFWLDFHQTQSNLYKWFRMQQHDWSSMSQKEPMLHLSLSSCTGYLLQLAISALRSASERRLMVPSQRGSKSLSRTFSFTIPGWWNDLPHPYPECWIPVNLQATTENSSLSTLLGFIQKKKKKLSLYLFLLLLACTYLNNAWDLVLRVCFFKMNRFMFSPIVSRFG